MNGVIWESSELKISPASWLLSFVGNWITDKPSQGAEIAVYYSVDRQFVLGEILRLIVHYRWGKRRMVPRKFLYEDGYMLTWRMQCGWYISFPQCRFEKRRKQLTARVRRFFECWRKRSPLACVESADMISDGASEWNWALEYIPYYNI